MELPARLIALPPYSFWISEAGSGSPVVLLHGLSASSRWWRRNLPTFAARHRVFAVDLIGFGAKRRLFRPGPLPLPFDEITSVLGAWLEDEKCGPVHLVGHSMGGHIAVLLAAARPELVRSLVLVGSTGIPFVRPKFSTLRKLRRRAFPGFRLGALIAADFLRAGPFSVAYGAAEMFGDDAREAMLRIQAPALVVTGESDFLVPRDYAKQIHGQIRDSRLLVLPDSGHVPMWEAAEQFNSAALQHFQDAESRVTSPSEPRTGFSWAIRGHVAGIWHRQSGADPRLVLVHGLGVSSAYFRRFASALLEAGYEVIAPDMPGFGYSTGRTGKPEQQADALARWATGMGLRKTVWVGHSTGCQVLESIQNRYPELVGGSIFLGPIWNGRKHPFASLPFALARDLLRERRSLLVQVAIDYYTAGIRNIVRHALFFVGNSTTPPVLAAGDLTVVGEGDPLTDLRHLRVFSPTLMRVPGAHAMHDSHPVELVRALGPRLKELSEI